MMGAFGIGEVWAEGSIKLHNIENLRILGRVNDHGRAVVSGNLKQEQAQALMKDSFKNGHLTLWAKGRERPLFSGLIESVRYTGEGELYRATIQCISYTSLLNQEKHNRSFQDCAMYYRDLLQQIRAGYHDKGRFVVTEKKAALNIEKPIIQYQETDWEFIKRIAGKLHTLLIAEITYPMMQLSVGEIQGACYELPESYEYEKIFDLDAFRSGDRKASRAYYISYRIKSDENYELGDKIRWNGQEYIVLEKELSFHRGIMEGNYLLGFKEGHCLLEYSNSTIKGASFPGTVIDRKEGMLKVHLDMDSEQKPENAYWYRYSPVTANVMYSVPELGAKVLLNIMSDEESNAVVSCCIRKDSGMLPLPEVKMMWSGMETYVAAPDYMGFCYEGIKATEALVLDDEIGFIVNTGKKLKLQAAGRIFLQGNGAVSIKGVTQTMINHPNAKEEQAFIAMDCGRMRLGGSPIVYSGGIVNGAKNQRSMLDAASLKTAGNDVLAMIPVATGKEGLEAINPDIYRIIEKGSLQSFGTEAETVSTMEESIETKGSQTKKATIYIGGNIELTGDVYEDGKTYIYPNQNHCKSNESLLESFFTGVTADEFKRDKPFEDKEYGAIRYYKPEYYTFCIEDLAAKTGYTDVMSSWEQSENSRIVVCHAIARNAPYQLVRNKDEVKMKLYMKVNAYEKDSEEDETIYVTKPFEKEYRWKYSKKPDLRQYTFYDFLTNGIRLWEGTYENKSKNGIIYDNFGLDGHVNVKIEFCKVEDLPIEAIRVYMFDNRKEAVDRTVYSPISNDKESDEKKLIIAKDYNWSQVLNSGFLIGSACTVLIYTKIRSGNFDWLYAVENSNTFPHVFAHEFGHVFGLHDAYDKRNQGVNSVEDWKGAPKTDEVTKNCMMRYNKNVEPNDVEMVLQGWMEGKTQFYFTYKSLIKSKAIRLDK